MSGCCGPDRVAAGERQTLALVRPATGLHRVAQCVVAGGVFAMGDARGDGRPADGETPVHPVRLGEFSIDATPVTNADFAAFVDATGYATEAEVFGSSAVFHLVVSAPAEDVLGRAASAPWWWDVRGADWRHPEGPRSDVDDRVDHPVVHVSWNDAQAYCRWAGRSLPTEAQWERASRGGLEGARYPWGDELMGADGRWRANIWQGRFPVTNTAEDGWLTTAPVRSYEPNDAGLWQTVGNVWEWCADVFRPRAYADHHAAGVVVDPEETAADGPRVLRGGSYLCHDSYCNRYRVSARTSNEPTATLANLGFRCVLPAA